MLIVYRLSDKKIVFNSGKSFIEPMGMSDINGKLTVIERMGGTFLDYGIFRLHDINDSVIVEEILNAHEYNLVFNEREEPIGYNITKTKEEWIAEQPPRTPSEIEVLREQLTELQKQLNILPPITNPISLQDYKINKISQITDLYNQKLSDGFLSSATGFPHMFGYGNSDQMKFMQLAIGVLSKVQPFPVEIPAKDNTKVIHTFEEYSILLQDIGIFAYTMNIKQHYFIDLANNCTSISDLNSIVVDFN